MIRVLKGLPWETALDMADASHGFYAANQIFQDFYDGKIIIVRVNDRLTTGIGWDTDTLYYFGFHGKLVPEDIDELLDFSERLARDKGKKYIKFISPRKAWIKLLKGKFKVDYYIYGRKICAAE